MTLEYRRDADGNERVHLTECSFCGVALDERVEDGGPGTAFPTHWQHRCPANGEAEADAVADGGEEPDR